MNQQKARTLAKALGGDSYCLTPANGIHGVSLNRRDGRFVLIEECCAATYPDEEDCWGGLDVLSDEQKAAVDHREWLRWGEGEAWAAGLAALLDGQAYRQGGDTWAVRFERLDGRFTVIGADWAETYEDRAAYERMERPERVEWA